MKEANDFTFTCSREHCIYVHVSDQEMLNIHMDFQEVTNYNILVKLGMLLQHLVFVMGFGLEIY